MANSPVLAASWSSEECFLSLGNGCSFGPMQATAHPAVAQLKPEVPCRVCRTVIAWMNSRLRQSNTSHHNHRTYDQEKGRVMLEHFDTVLSFAVVMLLLSLLVTTIVQMLLAVLGLRGSVLQWGLEKVLGPGFTRPQDGTRR
jgi:hypothetical protein